LQRPSAEASSSLSGCYFLQKPFEDANQQALQNNVRPVGLKYCESVGLLSYTQIFPYLQTYMKPACVEGFKRVNANENEFVI